MSKVLIHINNHIENKPIWFDNIPDIYEISNFHEMKIIDHDNNNINDMPTIIKANGDKIWRGYGKPDRINELKEIKNPKSTIQKTNIILQSDGTKIYYDDFYTEVFRIDGEGNKTWKEDDSIYYNRFDNKPCSISVNGDREWYDDKTERGMVITHDGTKKWMKSRRISRKDNKPAMISTNEVIWWKKYYSHRFGGPAEITHTEQTWVYDGYKHRLFGPAYINTNGVKKWYFLGHKIYSNE